MFDLAAAKRLAEDSKHRPPLPEKPPAVSPDTSREAAVAARNASRVLQSLPSKATFFL